MPKERRKCTTVHNPSVKLVKRQFAVQDTVEHVEIGAAVGASGADVLKSMDQEPRNTFSKKEKQHRKREAFVQRLESIRSPYSKSHNRRLKRKGKEQLAGGLGDMHVAITALEDDDISIGAQQTVEENAKDLDPEERKPKPKPKPGQIGEGKGTPLNKSQRKRALQMERVRHPLILSNPEFASNPFQTIRTHAQNTLLKHQPT